MFQHIKKWRLYQEANNVLGTVYTIQLSAVYHSRSIIVTFKDVSAVTIRDMETLSDMSDCLLHIEPQPHEARRAYLVEE